MQRGMLCQQPLSCTCRNRSELLEMLFVSRCWCWCCVTYMPCILVIPDYVRCVWVYVWVWQETKKLFTGGWLKMQMKFSLAHGLLLRYLWEYGRLCSLHRTGFAFIFCVWHKQNDWHIFKTLQDPISNDIYNWINCNSLHQVLKHHHFLMYKP